MQAAAQHFCRQAGWQLVARPAEQVTAISGTPPIA
jgi:hypothetical protein